MLQVSSLCFDYDYKPLLKDLSFSLEAGQMLHLRGKNGCGKTTLLRLLAGLLQPASGEIFYANTPMQQNFNNYRQQLCYLGHKNGLNLLLTVKENCYFDNHWQNTALTPLLDAFGLTAFADKPCHQLSAGLQRRASLLRLKMTQAKLWLLDEPLVALDDQSVHLLITCLQAHLEKGGQIIMTSHQALPPTLACKEYLLS